MTNINKGYPLFFTMIKIYLTRHSKTIWNEEKRLQGRQNSPLTQKGIENAKALKKYIQNIHFDYIYSSPIERAYHTAKIVFENQNIIKDVRLSEMNFGDFEGRKISDILKTDYELYHQLWHEPEKFTCIPNGETYDQVIERAHSFLNDLKHLPHGSQIMIVTHGMYFIVLLATMLGLEKKDFIKINQKVVDGCSLTCVEYHQGSYKLDFYNKCSFLPYIANESFSK